MSANPLSTPDSPFLPRQAVFIAEYLIDFNATQAAIRAGYTAEGAAVEGSALLRNQRILAAIERGKAQRLVRVNMTADTVLHELSLLATSCVEHYRVDNFGQLQPTEDAPDGAMRAVQSIKRKVRYDKDGSITYEVEFRLWDKPGALKLMGKHANVAACFDKLVVIGPNGGPIITKIVREVIDMQPQVEERVEAVH